VAEIIPTVLATDIQEYNRLVDVLSFAPILHIDVMDGKFAKPKSINLVQAHWPESSKVHIHLMVDNPAEHIETLVAKQPDVIILHAESSSFSESFTELQSMDIAVHVALLPETRPDDVPELAIADGCLIFGGKLGSYGGEADLSQLDKVETLRAMNPELTLGWDGGANEHNIAKLVSRNIEFINVGSAVQKAKNPQSAYATLVALAE